jgi:plasmid maintenance system antidote protein VapI
MALHNELKHFVRDSGRSMRWICRQIALNATAETAGFTDKKLSSSLLGKRSISAGELLAICKALGINPNIFLNTENETNADVARRAV